MNTNLYRNANLYCFALGCLLLGWFVHHRRGQQLDPVTRLRVAGAL